MAKSIEGNQFFTDSTKPGKHFVQTGVNGAIELVTSDDALVVNVKDFGATGDGSTDDLSAINEAIASQGSDVNLFFPQGTYFISDEIDISAKNNIKIVGYNSEIKIGFSANNKCAILIDGGEGMIDIDGLSFDFNAKNFTNYGIKVTDRPANKNDIKNCRFHNFGKNESTGIWLYRATYWTNGGGETSGMIGFTIDNCVFYKIVPTDYATYVPVDYSLNNSFGRGIELGEKSEFGVISNCHFNFLGTAVYQNGGANWTITHCTSTYCRGNVSTAFLTGTIHCVNQGALINQGKLIISSCRFDHQLGITIYSENTTVNHVVQIVNNQFIGNGAVDIYFKGTSEQIVQNNYFDRIADGVVSNSPFTGVAAYRCYIKLDNCLRTFIAGNKFRYSVNADEATSAIKSTGSNDMSTIVNNPIDNNLLPLAVLVDSTFYVQEYLDNAIIYRTKVGVTNGVDFMMRWRLDFSGGKAHFDFVNAAQSGFVPASINSSEMNFGDGTGADTNLWGDQYLKVPCATASAGEFLLRENSSGRVTSLDTSEVLALLGISGVAPLLTSFYTDVSATTSASDAYSYTLAANAMSANGNYIDGSYSADYTGGLGSGSNVIIYFGGQVVYTNIANILVTGVQVISFKIIRSGTTTARCIISYPNTSTGVQYTTTDLTGLDFTTTNIIKTTIIASTGNTLTMKTGTLNLYK